MTGHCGQVSIEVARQFGVETVFTLSGAHVFPAYDGAVKAEPPMRLLDVRHEQTAAFAAEATGKLTRNPGFAVVTAGPGVTNCVSALAQASFSGAPMVLLGGRAPHNRWGMGSLQELDHPPLVSSVVKHAETLADPASVGPGLVTAFTAATSAHRGPTFVDIPLETYYSPGEPTPNPSPPVTDREPDPDHINVIARALSQATHPVVILGTDVWADHAELAAREFVEGLGLPTITNGMGRGVLPAGHPSLVSKARSAAFADADLVLVIGTPLDFRVGYGVFGGKAGRPPAAVMHIADSPEQLATHAELVGQAAGGLANILNQLTQSVTPAPGWADWLTTLQQAAAKRAEADAELLNAAQDPIHPARIYGELAPRLAEDAVVIGDGGDFVSFAGRFIEPGRPGCWLDPGPFGCLGAGFGAAIAARLARPSAQVTLLAGDGALGFSLADLDTLVRHQLPVVIIVGNNSAWGLEKGPMQMLYGYDVAADLAPNTAYHLVAQALGADAELVTHPKQIGPALDRAYAASAPYLVNIMTDVNAAYPRTTFGI